MPSHEPSPNQLAGAHPPSPEQSLSVPSGHPYSSHVFPPSQTPHASYIADPPQTPAHSTSASPINTPAQSYKAAHVSASYRPASQQNSPSSAPFAQSDPHVALPYSHEPSQTK